jgi:hypothetical protein
MSKSKLAIASKIVGVIFAIYILIYMVLSLNGSYQPDSYDLRGPMSYARAPCGFYDPNHAWKGSSYAVHHPTEKTGGWSTSMEISFLPLYCLDCEFIHKWNPDKTSSKN